MYSFRITACVTKDWRFNDPQLTLVLDGMNPVTVSSSDQRFQLNDENLWVREDIDRIRLCFDSHEYKTKEDAERAGQHLQHALTLLGVAWRTPIDPGFIPMLSNTPNSGVYVATKDKLLKGSYSGGGRITRIKSPEKITQSLNEYLRQSPISSDRIRAAAILANHELCGGLKCSLDDGLGRLVARVSAIEALTECPKRSDAVQKCIDEIQKIISEFAGLSDAERKQLKDGIGMHRNESISSSCRAMIRRRLEGDETKMWIDDPEKQFSKAYGYRSSFLHAGKHSEENVNNLESHDMVRSVGIDIDFLIQRLVLENVG